MVEHTGGTIDLSWEEPDLMLAPEMLTMNIMFFHQGLRLILHLFRHRYLQGKDPILHQ